MTIQIQHRCTGAAGDPGEGGQELELLEESISAGELIRRSVREQIRTLRREGAFDQSLPREDAAKLFLSESDIRKMASEGKVTLPDPNDAPLDPASPDFVEAAEERALSAFKRGLFTILIGGRQVESTSETLDFHDQTTAIFLRLVPLVGG